MANIFQTTSGGYRDANKALTIKALEARQKAALDAKAAALQPTTIADPLQGIAGMMDVLGAGMQQRRADQATSEARNTLAKLKAGITDYSHIDPNTLSQIGTLDPDTEKWLTEQQLKIQDREATQSFTHGENVGSREATAAENELNRKSQATLQDDQQQAQRDADAARAKADAEAATLADTRAKEQNIQQAGLSSDYAKLQAERTSGTIDEAEFTRRKATLDEAAQVAIEKNKPESFGPIVQGKDLGLTGAAADVPFQQNAKTKQWEPVTGKGGTSVSIKTGTDKLYDTLGTKEGERWDKMRGNRDVAVSRKADLEMLDQLINVAPQGPITGALMEKFPILKGYSNAATALDAITKRLAPTMHISGTGSQSDIEYKGALDSLTSINNMPDANRLIVQLLRNQSNLDIQRGTIIDDLTDNKIDLPEAHARMRELETQSAVTPEMRQKLDIATNGKWLSGGITVDNKPGEPATPADANAPAGSKPRVTVKRVSP